MPIQRGTRLAAYFRMSKRSIALVLLLTLAGGCTSQRQALKWTAVGVGAAIAGGLLIRDFQHDEEVPSGVVLTALVLVFGGGGTALASGLDAIFGYSDPVVKPNLPAHAVQPPSARSPTPVSSSPSPEDERLSRLLEARARAWAITQASATAARTGDCTIALAADAEVRALDLEFHATVFLGDVAIKRCLTP